MSTHRFQPGAILVAALFASARPASAQQTVADVLTFLVTNQNVATGNPQFDRTAAQATSEAISRALLANMATLPVTSSSGAFVYRLNPELGTMVLRAKYTVFADRGSGVAASVDVRLPTGREENLLGAGATSLRFSGIASVESGRATLHANGGYSVGGLARELSYGSALAIAATGRVTVTGELIGRRLDGIGRIVPSSAPTPGLVGVETIRLVPDASSLSLVTVVPGVKWNVTDTWILVGNVGVPLTDAGLTARFTPFVGVDYAFGR